ncbi:uncharacterized protein LOC142979172 [Anticarsia gemmatalis]|uniref:uncharacterized protein LOC142979172 n=1 Tax=Anticarsia gemmatalis TaxID=129554 RepID=UPI003F772324
MANGGSSKYKLSRRGRKLNISDDQRTLNALPKDVPERTWAEIFQREEVDLVVFDIREEILEIALEICYNKYMDRQNAIFTAHCTAQAWLKLIDWHFYRHDPGEDPSAFPPCCIPRRRESWIPDQIPDPSPKDTWTRHDLAVIEETREEGLQKWSSSRSLDLPHVEEIPSEYWFPGKINVPMELRRHTDMEVRPSYDSSESTQTASEENIGTESEVLQKVTDYSTEELSKVSTFSALKTTTPVDGSLHGAGDSTVERPRPRRFTDKSKSLIRIGSRPSRGLPTLDVGDSRSRISIISDCRLRNLRLDTHYEITSEKVDTPPGEIVKRK